MSTTHESAYLHVYVPTGCVFQAFLHVQVKVYWLPRLGRICEDLVRHTAAKSAGYPGASNGQRSMLLSEIH